MRRVVTVLAVGVALALPAGLLAQEAADSEDICVVQPSQVDTWTMTYEDKDWSVRPATPSYMGDTGLFHVPSAYTLPKGKVAFSIFRDNYDRDPKDLDISIHGFNIAYGATDKLEVFGQVGVQNRVDADAIFQGGFANEYPFAGTQDSSPGWQTGFGDVWVGAKYKFLDDYTGDGVGLAIRARAKLPTADETKGLGTGKFSGAGELVLSKNFNQAAEIHGFIGFETNSSPDMPEGPINTGTVEVGNALTYGVGVNFPCCKNFQIQADMMARNYSGASVDQTNPIDIVVGPVFWFKSGVFVRPAISWNINFDDRGLGSSMKSYTGGQVSVGYHPGTPCCEVFVPPPPPPPPVNKPPTVECSLSRSSIEAGEQVTCNATASDPDGDPLTYSWSASAGSVTGDGATATYDSQGVAAPATVTVTVKVSDGRGGTAESSCNVTIDTSPPPEPITCTSGGFPRNLSRLNNVDKACLDDVASKLRQDPRSRVIIVGHADSKERHPEVISRKRAEAIKAYLVSERGIEESRIAVRGAANSKLLDTGTTAAARAKNRRVEVIFLAEGAVAPEEDD